MEIGTEINLEDFIEEHDYEKGTVEVILNSNEIIEISESEFKDFLKGEEIKELNKHV